MLLVILFVILAIVHILDSRITFIDKIKYIIIIHLTFIVIEILIEIFKLYKIYVNDYNTNNQPANVK